jgi:hypothetical protein
VLENRSSPFKYENKYIKRAIPDNTNIAVLTSLEIFNGFFFDLKQN